MNASSARTNIKIEQVDIKLLKPSAYNPRKISAKAFEDVKESLRRYDLIDPLIVNSNPKRRGIIIGGHQRYRAAKELGYKTVPVVYINLYEAKEKELNLRLNRNTGEWDLELLKQFDFDMLLDVGFDDTDLGDIWDDALETDDDDFDEEKAVKKAAETTIQPGQMFKLGRHRLICGDSSDPAVIKRLVGDNQPSILYCDPPFNIGLDYDKGVGLKAGYGGKTNDSKSDTEYRAFLSDILASSLSALTADTHVFMYCDQNYIGLLQSLMAEHGLKNRRVCLWIKNGFNVVPQVAFNKAYEPCVYATRGNPYLAGKNKNLIEILNKDIAAGNRTLDDIVDLFDIWLARREPGQEYQHPTQKPVTLHEKPIKRCTKVGDVVLDVFGGSGSTLVACEQMKRTALLCEIEPVFCQVIIDRYEALTGEKAVQL